VTGDLRRRRPDGARDPEDRAKAGLFLAFQHPTEIPGVGNMYFLRSSGQRHARTAMGLPEIAATDFLKQAKAAHGPPRHGSCLPQSLGERRVLRRREEAQRGPPDVSLLEPRLAILDETDSGLDVDALRDRRPAASSALRGPPTDRCSSSPTTRKPARRWFDPTTCTCSPGTRSCARVTIELATEIEAQGYLTGAAAPA
jgi:Fe-S cluster assembly ATP-binding protein